MKNTQDIAPVDVSSTDWLEDDEIAWQWFADAHPHEAYATWPERFWSYFQTKAPGKSRQEMERLLVDTAEFSNVRTQPPRE